ncbi:MAG: class I SAM-dependent methyltransferase, partial [Candidatus Binataceae bacterium]
HHMSDPVAAFREVARTLTAGAHFVILNSNAEQTSRYWLNEYFPLAMRKAIAQYKRIEAADALRAAGLRVVREEPYEVADDLQDQFLYIGKHRPQMYLDPTVRAGISFFADPPDSNEVERGVAQLGADIKSGRIREVMFSYAHDGGDYVFTVARKLRGGDS